ncbi:MAG: phosphatidic acid phosphatase [Ruminococcaceae bacterium]|nr:phosphatidic acid phosphatase [Oscillospiraceae bacterium]
MTSPVVDYREFRLSRLNEPRFSHLKLLGGWIGYFILYFLTENLIPFDKCHVIHCALDDLIPFNEFFAIFYCYWYALLVFSLAYFLLYDIPSFKRLQVFIIITQAVAMVVYIAYPSVQFLRPEVMPRDNFLCRLMAFIYSFDTPSGVLPSLHVAYSMGLASVWWKYRRAPRWWRVAVIASAVIISISTTFVKQHSALDVVTALPVGFLAEYLVYGTPFAKSMLHRRLHAYLHAA